MASTLTKATTLLFLVATFCLTGIALAEDDETTPIHPPDDSFFTTPPPSSVDPPVDSHFSPPSPPSVVPPADSPFSPPPPPSVDPPADSPFGPPSPVSVDPPADSPFSPPPPPSVDPSADSPFSPPPTSSVDPPTDSPFSPPFPQPVDPPAQPPVPRKPEQRGVVAIKGDVFCQSCKNAGSDNLTDASPIYGAVVTVKCKINETVIELIGVTSGQGYFFLQKVDVNINDFDNCKAYLALSPLTSCNIPTNLHGGITGSELKRHQPPSFGSPYALFTVKPFAFLPKCN